MFITHFFFFLRRGLEGQGRSEVRGRKLRRRDVAGVLVQDKCERPGIWLGGTG